MTYKNNKTVVIVDYGAGNISTVMKALAKLGYAAILTSDPVLIVNADILILPGVGSFNFAMKNLNYFGLSSAIKQFVASGKTILGICLGFQLLFEHSEEFGKCEGLGLLKGSVKPIKSVDKSLIVPHVGWNQVSFLNPCEGSMPHLLPLLCNKFFYFVHSFYVNDSNNTILSGTTSYNDFKFCSVVINDNIVALQFHPEKSGKSGLALLDAILAS